MRLASGQNEMVEFDGSASAYAQRVSAEQLEADAARAKAAAREARRAARHGGTLRSGDRLHSTFESGEHKQLGAFR